MTNTFPSVHVLWSATDEQFFRVTAELFSPTFVWGASTLLGSYDPDPTVSVTGSSTASPAVAKTVPTPTAVTA